MKSMIRTSALMALALAATVATTTAANASTAIAITPSPSADSYEINGSSNLSGWTSASGGYNFVFSTAGQAVNTGAETGLVMDGATSGSDFIALDADYPSTLHSPQPGVSTSIGSLVAGDVVTITFNFAGSQQKSGSDNCSQCTGNFDAHLAVTLGGATPNAGGALLNAATGLGAIDTTTSCSNQGGVSPCITSQEWSGWESETLTFDVTAANSGLLSFVASDPNASAQDPAFALIDDVTYSVTPPATPEPSSLLLLGTGLAGLSGLLRSRFKKSASAVV